MKYIFSLIIILSAGLFFSGCERDENGRMPDDIQDANTGLFIINRSDPFINLGAPASYELELTVDILFEGNFNKIDVVVVYNGDYANPHVVTSVTSVPSTITITGQDLIDAVPGLASADNIEEGDVFNLYTSIEMPDGRYLPGYTILGSSALSPGIRNIIGSEKGGVANIIINVPCEFNIDDYLGAVNISEYWAPDLYESTGEVGLDPDYTGTDPTKRGLILVGLWDGTWNLKVELSTYDYSIRGLPASQVMAASVFGYSTPTWSQISGTVNTCEQTLTVNVGRFCVTVGCFGGMPITYTTKKIPASKKSAAEIKNIQIPLRIERFVE
jgi:hypothetical protein